MLELLAAILLTCPQDAPTQEKPASPAAESKLAAAWPKLQEAWEACRPKEGEDQTRVLTDEQLRPLGKLAAAFEAAGFFEKELPFESWSVKNLMRHHAAGLLQRSSSMIEVRIVEGPAVARVDLPPAAAFKLFREAIQAMRDLRGPDAKDRDEKLAQAQLQLGTALKGLSLIAEDMPEWQRRRTVQLSTALALGDAYPAPEKATPEQERRFRELIDQLSDDDPAKRDQAASELGSAGPEVVPFLEAAAASEQPEIRERAKKLLWTARRDVDIAGDPQDTLFQFMERALRRVEPAPEDPER